jgi:L-fuconolactonase
MYEAARKLLPSEAAVTGEMMVEAMANVGVSGALLVATSHYGFDSSYSLEAARRFPERFRVVGRIDPLAPDASDRVARWREEPYGVALRIVVLSDTDREHVLGGAFDNTLRAAEREAVPLCFVLSNVLSEMAAVAQRYPDLQIVIDHLGLPRPPRITHEQLWSEAFPQLLALGQLPNIALKLSAIPALSAEPFPFRDLWPRVDELIAVFGAERLMWGSDWSAHRDWPYDEQVQFIRDEIDLTTDERRLIMGGALRRIFRWSTHD